MSKNTDPLARWSARALHDIILPSGQRVKVRIPSPEALVGQLPSGLRKLALQAATSSASVGDAASEEELTEFLAFTTHLVCETLREVWDEGSDSWLAVSLTPDELRALELPEEDMTALMKIAGRARTPAQIDAESRAQLGQLTPAAARQIVREEAAGTVDAFAPFRDQPGGAGDGPDGQSLPLQPGGDVLRDKRSGAGPARRRRAAPAVRGVGAS